MSLSFVSPKILALDFDGVLCDGLIEYFQSTWRAYCQIWPETDSTPPAGLADRFYRLRPVIETGWEMPILVHALMQNTLDSEILTGWPFVSQQLVRTSGLNPKDVSKLLDGIRDHWIASDLDGWLACHQFYAGVIEQVKRCLEQPLILRIVTTKEARFVRQLLQQQGIDLPDEFIIGKESKRPKYEILRDLKELAQLTAVENDRIWFVEDRLKTLQLVQQQADLAGIQLFLADWGYVTDNDIQAAKGDPGIHLLNLDRFAQNFAVWI